MRIGRLAAEAINPLLRIAGAELVSTETLAHYREVVERNGAAAGPSYASYPLPGDAAEYLCLANPRIQELRERYRQFRSPVVTASTWSPQHISKINLQYFRGDNPYVYQYLDNNTPAAYILTAYHLAATDTLGLFERLSEDNLFGAYTYAFNGDRLVSRDFLDSVSEILFLEETIGLSHLAAPAILDIGAGYGRLAYRLVSALSNLGPVFCTDAIAESTFVSEFYLTFRGVGGKARAVPLDDIEKLLQHQPIDLAVNIHSFSECTLAAVCWWLDLLCRHRVRYLLIIPNAARHGGTRLLTSEADGRNRDYVPALEERGYSRIAVRPKYTAPCVQKHGVSPTIYHLFKSDK